MTIHKSDKGKRVYLINKHGQKMNGIIDTVVKGNARIVDLYINGIMNTANGHFVGYYNPKDDFLTITDIR